MGRKPRWPELVEDIIARIQNGEDPLFRRGQKVPSDRILMKHLSVARGTVRQVKRALIERGWLVGAWRGLMVRPRETITQGPLFRRGRFDVRASLKAIATWQAAMSLAAVRHAKDRLPVAPVPEFRPTELPAGMEKRAAIARRRFERIETFFKTYELALDSEGLSRIGVTVRRYLTAHYGRDVEWQVRPKTLVEALAPEWFGWSEEDWADQGIASDGDAERIAEQCALTSFLLTEYGGVTEVTAIQEAVILGQIETILGVGDSSDAFLLTLLQPVREPSREVARAVRELQHLRRMIITEKLPFVAGATAPTSTVVAEMLGCTVYKADTACRLLRAEGWLVGDTTASIVGPGALWLEDDVFEGVRVDHSDLQATFAIADFLLRNILGGLAKQGEALRKTAASYAMEGVAALVAAPVGRAGGKGGAPGNDELWEVLLLERTIGILAWANGNEVLTELMVLVLRYIRLAYGEALAKAFKAPSGRLRIGGALQADCARLSLDLVSGRFYDGEEAGRSSSFFNELEALVDAHLPTRRTFRILGEDM